MDPVGAVEIIEGRVAELFSEIKQREAELNRTKDPLVKAMLPDVIKAKDARMHGLLEAWEILTGRSWSDRV